ncbi:MAG: CDP-glucose 4,6-dehydratase [Sphingomonadales bacterium]|nr:CDP-glucose 4,6-dehydratase [Sphingomonadales bacterium]
MNIPSNSFWPGKRVLVTGHTGFKGAWLALWLEMLGAKVSALALPPATDPALFHLLAPWRGLEHANVDIRDFDALNSVVQKVNPEIVLHLAAQALVRKSYRDPLETFGVNVMGTANLLEAVRSLDEFQAAVIVTTDKVYENDASGRAFRETDRLGGKDPYSNSKACAELVSQCYRDSFFAKEAPLATARAGNVVGGGDWSEDRLVPDLIRAMLGRQPVSLRHPNATRPWQHVLEPLGGYLMLAEKLAEGRSGLPFSFNFGPDQDSTLTVANVVDVLNQELGISDGWVQAEGDHPPEAPVLALDSSLATAELGWKPKLDMRDTIRWTAEWYRDWNSGADPRTTTLRQIDRYMSL